MRIVTVPNADAEANAIDAVKPRIPVYLTLVAASLVPIFLAGVSMLSCQQRHYIESKWGGFVVLSSIVIYSFGKRSAGTLTVSSSVADREAIISTRSIFGSLRRGWRSAVGDNDARGGLFLGKSNLLVRPQSALVF